MVAILVVAALIAIHVGLLGLAFHRLPLVIVAGVCGLLLLKYGWWRFRRDRNRSARPTG